MSNKLIKRSEGYEKVKKRITDKVNKEGGININGTLLSECISVSGKDEDKCTEDEFYSILEEMSNTGFCLYKIEKVIDGKSSKGMMICTKDTILAFVKDNEVESDIKESK